MATGLLPLGVAITGTGLTWLLWVSLRRRYLSRLALRQFARRPWETLLVIAGSILGTALITGSFITGDSLTASFTDSVFQSLGEVDEQVLLTSPRAVRQAERHIEEIRDLDIVDGAALTDRAVAVVRSAADENRTDPRTYVYSLDVSQLDDFGSTQQTLGGPGLTPNEAVITEELADKLRVGVGDTVEILVFERERSFVIDRIASGDGFGSYRDGRDLYIAPGILSDLAEAGNATIEPTHEMWVSNRGDARLGRDLTFPVTSQVDRILDDEGVEVLHTKKTFLDTSEQSAEDIGQLFLVIATFAVVAGILLLVNIFVMLAAERRSELGMLRAVGMKRGDLVRGFALEGSLYGGSAAIVGVFVGIGVGAAIVFIADRIFSGAQFFAGLHVDLALRRPTLLAGLVIGFAISFVTIFVTSVRISRVNIIAAIRDLEAPRVVPGGIRNTIIGALAVVVGSWLTVSGLAVTDAIPALIGPAILGVGLVLLLARFVPQRVLISAVGLGVFLWGVTVPFLIDLFKAEQEFVFVVQGLTTTFAAMVVLTVNQEFISAAARRLTAWRPRAGLAARLATTYPVARRFRTGMTLIMYALIVFTLVLITTFGHVIQLNTEAIVRQESAGFDIAGSTNRTSPTTADEIEATAGVDFAYGILASPYTFTTADEEEDSDTVYGVDSDFIRLTRYGLEEYDDSYPSPDAVWQAVAADPSLVIVDQFYMGQQQRAASAIVLRIGDRIEMTDPVTGTSEERTVVAFNGAGLAMPGAFISARALDKQFAAAGKTQWLIRSDQDTDSRTLVDRLNADHVDVGLQAVTIEEVVQDIMSINYQFFGLLRGYLALGLVVGIVGLGVIMVRAVRERRRAIGVLRALGFRASTVRQAFVSEAGIVSAEGILTGIALGVITARSVIYSSLGDQFDVPFAVPWSSVAILATLTFVFSVLVAVLPARAASKIRPAVALRIAD